MNLCLCVSISHIYWTHDVLGVLVSARLKKKLDDVFVASIGGTHERSPGTLPLEKRRHTHMQTKCLFR